MLTVLNKWANMTGLVLGIAGAVVLAIWGPLQPSFQRGLSIGVENNFVMPDGRTVAQHDADIGAAEQRHQRISRSGFVLIGLGFLCQVYASWPKRRADRPDRPSSDISIYMSIES
jgi:hypothetical protein